MTAEEIVYDLMANSEFVTEVVADRIFPIVADPQTLKPYIQFRRTSTDPQYDLSSTLISQFAEIRIELIASEFSELQSLWDVVNAAVDVYPCKLTNSGHIVGKLAGETEEHVISAWQLYSVFEF